MKKLFVVFVTLVSCLMLNAQEKRVKSLVELNGSKDSLFGYVSQYPDGSYLVETDAADIFYFSASEVKRVSAIPLKSKGYMGLVEAGVGYPGQLISIINGYRFSPNSFLGIGVGGGSSTEYFASSLIFPFFLQARTEFTKGRVKKTAPYLAFNLGCSYVVREVYSYIVVEDLKLEAPFLPMADITFGFRSYCRNHGALWYGITAGFLDYSAIIISLGFKLAYSF